MTMRYNLQERGGNKFRNADPYHPHPAPPPSEGEGSKLGFHPRQREGSKLGFHPRQRLCRNTRLTFEVILNEVKNLIITGC